MNLPTEAAASTPGGAIPDPRTSRNNGGPLKPITMAAIAKAAGVSQGAISSLLNDRDYGIRVSDRTRDKVFKVCRELGYMPNDLRAVVRMYPEQGDTCLLLPARAPGGLAHPFVSRIAAGILSAAAPRANLAIAHYDESRDYSPDSDTLPQPISNGTASKFLCLGSANPSLCRIAARRGYPFILLGHEAPLAGATSIVPDYAEAARLALGHLVKLGHKNIAIVGGPFGSPEPRLAELNRAIGVAAQELGLYIEAQNIFQGDLSFNAGIAALDSLLSRSPAPTAAFCLSEQSACGVLAGAHTKGISVPGQLSVIALADHTQSPPSCIGITTVALPVEEMAATAAQEAARQIRAGIPFDAQRILLPVKFCERETCSPAKK
jgi:LacI family repressor for deo operon, udp, cdd, tsx, nupC, and nupG